MTFTEALYAAQDTDDPSAYIDRVKNAVQAELEVLDLTSMIERTSYFNHTAVPDFIVSWPGESGKRDTPRRAVFLRHSYRSIASEGDEHFLGSTDAMIMAIRSAGKKIFTATARGEAAAKSRLLLTDSEAVGLVADQGLSSNSGDANLLGDLIRANFIRGAKGRIDRSTASRLLDLNGTDTLEGEPTVTDLIAATFSEDAAARISRTAQLIDIASEGTADGNFDLVGGQLSLAEMRHLVPWLLKRDPDTIHETFWPYAGTLFSFKDLEAIRDDLSGLDLTPLIIANADRWSAKRAYVGLAIEPDDGENESARDQGNEADEVADEEDEGVPDATSDVQVAGAQRDAAPRRWGFHPGSLSALSVDVGNLRLYVAQNGTLLKGRSGSSSATWERVKETMGSTRLRRVELRGIQSSVSINAEQSPDVQGQVSKVTESFDDRYFIDAVTVRYRAPGDKQGHSDVDIKFGQNLAIAADSASIADITSAALSIAEYRSPASSEEVDALLGRTVTAIQAPTAEPESD